MCARQVHTFRPLVRNVRLEVRSACLLFLVEVGACGGLRCVYLVSFFVSESGRICFLRQGRIGMEVLGRDTTGTFTANNLSLNVR